MGELVTRPANYPCIQICVPRHAKFQDIDMFSLYYSDSESPARVLMGAQLKEGNQEARTEPPALLPKAWFICGKPKKRVHTYPVQSRSCGKGRQMWVAPSVEETLGF